jgi:lysophospholipase L1-like esterase
MLSTILPSVSPDQFAASTRLSGVLRAAARAAISNPRNAGPYAGPITITDAGATLPAQTNLFFTFATGGSVATTIWRWNGGRFVFSNGLARFASAFIDATTTAPGLGAGGTANWWRASIMAASRYVALRLQPNANPYRILIDDRYVSSAGTVLGTTTGTAHQYLLLDFGTRGARKITIEGMQTAGIAGAYVEPTGTLWPVDVADQPRGVFLGDSYVVGAAATNYADGVAPVMFDWLGARGLASGSGGTGWATTNSAFRLDERIARGDLLLDGTPDFVCLMASVNDRVRDPALVQANSLAGLQSARAQLPGVPIVVFGCMPMPAGPLSGSPSLVTSETAVMAAVAAFADPLCRFVPVAGDPAGAWTTGTGAAGTETGSGTADWMFNADRTHLNDAGCAVIGRRYAATLVAALAAMPH